MQMQAVILMFAHLCVSQFITIPFLLTTIDTGSCVCLRYLWSFWAQQNFHHITTVFDIMPEWIIVLNSDLREIYINVGIKVQKIKHYTSMATSQFKFHIITLER